jgi:hypothetical protein
MNPDNRSKNSKLNGQDPNPSEQSQTTNLSEVKSHSISEEVSNYSKPCTLCHTPKDVLIRCQIDETRKWHFVCTGRCWKEFSGGVVDGDGSNTWYRYGGMWKNRHIGVSAKIKGKSKMRNRWNGRIGGEHGSGDDKES